MRKVYDISVGLREGMPTWPGDEPFESKRSKSISKGDEANLSTLRMSAHSGTHIDSPLHYIEGGGDLGSIPFEALLGPVTVIGVEGKAVTAEKIAKDLEKARKRVLFKTSNSERLWERGSFTSDFAHIEPDGARLLASSRLLTVGVDYLSVGSAEGGAEVHRIMLEAGICIIEGLNLKDVPPGDYNLFCLPLNIPGCEGAPARAVLTEPGSGGFI